MTVTKNMLTKPGSSAFLAKHITPLDNRSLQNTIVSLLAVLGVVSQISAAQLKDGEMTPPLGAGSGISSKPELGIVIYVNGQNTDSEKAQADAILLAAQIGSPIHLLYNDLTLPVVDWFSTVIEKVGGSRTSVNAATASLKHVIIEQLERGNSICLIGHSAGSLSILNAVRAVSFGYEQKLGSERKRLMSRIHILTVGGATFCEENIFADKWPELGSIFHLYDRQDSVAALAGEGDFPDASTGDFDEHHGLRAHYLGHIKPSMLSSSGNQVLNQ